jgi:hypothetical protein
MKLQLSLFMMIAAAHCAAAELPADVEQELQRCEKLLPERQAAVKALDTVGGKYVRLCADNAAFRISVLQGLRLALADGCKIGVAPIKRCLEGADYFLECASGDRDPFEGIASGTRAFRSVVDDEFLFYSVKLPKGYDPKRKHRLEVVLHSGGALIWRANWIQNFGPPAGTSSETSLEDAITITPCGRGNNSYKGLGRTAIIEAVRDAQKYYPIDEDRIMVGGASMGGTGAYALTAFYPDLFAAGHSLTGSPIYGVPKSHGLLDPSCVIENLANTAFCQWLEPGDMEARLGRLWTERLQKLRDEHAGFYPHRSILDPKGSHGHIETSLVTEGMAWVRAQKRSAWPEYVVLKACNLRHNRAHWVTLDAMADATAWAQIEAKLVKPEAIQISTQNVKTFHLDLGRYPHGKKELEVQIDGSTPLKISATGECYFTKGETWTVTPPPSPDALMKRHALSGPMYDAFMGEPVVFVYGTAQGRTAVEGEKLIDGVVKSLFGGRDGGTTIHGEFRRCADTAVPAGDHHLVLVGRPETNQYLKKIADRLPAKFGPGVLAVGGNQFSGADLELLMIYPNPDNPKYYVLIVPEFFVDCPVNALMTYGDYAIGRRTSGYGGNHFTVVAEGKFDSHWQPLPAAKSK